MQQRQQEFYRGFDQESPPRSKPADEDFDAEYSQEVQDHLEEGGRCEEAEGKPDDDDEAVSFDPDLCPHRRSLLDSRILPWRTCFGALI